MNAASSYRLSRVFLGGVAGVALALSLSACTSDAKQAASSGGVTAPSSVSASGSAAAQAVDFDVADAKSYLLVGADLGGGYKPLAESQIQQALALQATAQGQTEEATVEPATCAEVADSQSALGARLAKAAESAAVTVLTPAGKISSGTDVITEALTPGPAVISAIDPSALKSCSSITIKGPVASTKLDLAPVEVPALGDSALGIKITAVSSVGTAQVAVNTVIILVDENDKNLTVSIANVSKTTPTPSADLETTAVRLAKKAYAKAEKFLSA